ncbi:MAG: hypothetical protein AAFX01_10855 [Cyanobacteria bacterium J06638_28]
MAEIVTMTDELTRRMVQADWMINLKRMKRVVFMEPQDDRYQNEQILTTEQLTPVQFSQVNFAVDPFIRR